MSQSWAELPPATSQERADRAADRLAVIKQARELGIYDYKHFAEHEDLCCAKIEETVRQLLPGARRTGNAAVLSGVEKLAEMLKKGAVGSKLTNEDVQVGLELETSRMMFYRGGGGFF